MGDLPGHNGKMSHENLLSRTPLAEEHFTRNTTHIVEAGIDQLYLTIIYSTPFSETS